MTLPTISGEFYVANEPEFRYTSDGLAVLRLRVKATYRKKDDSAPGGYRDDKVLWANANVWREKAEHAYASIQKGDLVVLTGNIYINEYESQGQKRQSTEIDVENIGPSLRYRETPHSGQAANGNNQQQPASNQQPAAATASAPATSGGDSEFPF